MKRLLVNRECPAGVFGRWLSIVSVSARVDRAQGDPGSFYGACMCGIVVRLPGKHYQNLTVWGSESMAIRNMATFELRLENWRGGEGISRANKVEEGDQDTPRCRQRHAPTGR